MIIIMVVVVIVVLNLLQEIYKIKGKKQLFLIALPLWHVAAIVWWELQPPGQDSRQLPLLPLVPAQKLLEKDGPAPLALSHPSGWAVLKSKMQKKNDITLRCFYSCDFTTATVARKVQSELAVHPTESRSKSTAVRIYCIGVLWNPVWHCEHFQIV